MTIIPVNDSDGIPSFEDVNDVFIRRQVELTITDTSDAKASDCQMTCSWPTSAT